MDEWDCFVPLNVHPSIQMGNLLKWELKLMLLICNRNLAFPRPHAKTQFHQAVLVHWESLTALLIGGQL